MLPVINTPLSCTIFGLFYKIELIDGIIIKSVRNRKNRCLHLTISVNRNYRITSYLFAQMCAISTWIVTESPKNAAWMWIVVSVNNVSRTLQRSVLLHQPSSYFAQTLTHLTQKRHIHRFCHVAIKCGYWDYSIDCIFLWKIRLSIWMDSFDMSISIRFLSKSLFAIKVYFIINFLFRQCLTSSFNVPSDVTFLLLFHKTIWHWATIMF